MNSLDYAFNLLERVHYATTIDSDNNLYIDSELEPSLLDEIANFLRSESLAQPDNETRLD